MTLDPFVKAYLETALLSSTDGGISLDENYSVEDIAEVSIQQAIKDCNNFKELAGSLLNDPVGESVAHDFWLTRNRHGAEFWYSDYPKDIGERLIDISHSFGECDLYIGYDGYVYLS